MKIGNKDNISIIDIQKIIPKIAIWLVIVAIILISIIHFIVLNLTSIKEDSNINKIAVFNGYDTTEIDNYKLLNNKDINIIYRYDELKVDTSNENMYLIDSTKDSHINSEQNILINIDNMLNPIKSKRLGYGESSGYYIESIINKLDNTQINFKSNLVLDDIDACKNIVQYEPISTDTMQFSNYEYSTIEEYVEAKQKEWEEHQRIKLGEDANSVYSSKNKSKALLYNNISNEYKYYTTIVVIGESEGIIIGNCLNKDKNIKELNKTVDKILLTLL